MINGAELMKRLLDAMLPNRAAPALARVLKAHEGSGKTRYSVDVRVVKAGTLEDTEQVISEVPLNPIWAGKKKRGVYAIPGEGQVVIIGFLCWNPAYPYVAGMWADEYEADEFGKDRFIITDGEGAKFEIDAGARGITLDNGEGCIVKLEKGNKVSLDNGKLQVILNGEKCAVKNGSKSLFTVLDKHFDNLIGMKTVGSPARHIVSPGDITKIKQDKADLGDLLEG
jgi:hypothetical protein